MEHRADQTGSSWRQKAPLGLGVLTGGVLFIYLVLPGFVLGLLFKAGVIDAKANDLETKKTVHAIFYVPMFLGNAVKPLGDFYEWQMFVVSGYR